MTTHKHQPDEHEVCDDCLVRGAANVLEFADIMLEHFEGDRRDDSPVIPIALGEIIALVLMPACACGECENRVDARSIAKYVIDRMAQTD